MENRFKFTSLKQSLSSAHLLSACAFGAFLSWLTLVFRSVNAPPFSLAFGSLSFPRNDEGWLAALLSVCIVGFVVGLLQRFNKRKWYYPRKIPLMGICAFLMAGGGALQLFSSASFWSIVIGGIICGTATTLYLVERATLFCPIDTRETIRIIIGGLLISSFIDALFLVLIYPIALLVLSILPLIAFICIALSNAKKEYNPLVPPAEHPSSTSQEGISPFSFGKIRIFTLLLAFMGFAFFMGIVGFNMIALLPQDLLTQQASIMGGGSFVSACILFLVERFLSLELLQLFIPLMLATALLLLPLSSQPLLGEIAIILAQAALFCSFAFAICLLEELKQTLPGKNLQGICSRALSGIAFFQLLGIIAGGTVRSLFGIDLTTMTITAMLTLYFIFLAVLILTHGKQKIEHTIDGSIASAAEISHIQSTILSQRFPELSVREQEILPFLLQGYSNARIADTLVVSSNTVKTHVRHIYAKLGINSRQKLLELAESVPLKEKVSKNK